jgi:hypothetical protein
MREQRRGRKIAMTPEEVDAFLAQERTVRVASVGADGRPHVAPLWFAWDGSALWLYSLTRSQRWTDLLRDPRVAAVADAGTGFHELRGVEISGTAEVVGEAPASVTTPETREPGRIFAQKYVGGTEMVFDGRHGWLRITPDKISSWDFRKNPALRPG